MLHSYILNIILDRTRIKPTYLSVKKGDIATFICDAKNEVHWFFENDEEHISICRILVIKDVQESDQGFYECRSTTDNGDHFRAIVELELESKSPTIRQ